MNLICCDPGKNGGIATRSESEFKVDAYNMPSTTGDIIEFFRKFDRKSVVVIEDVTGFVAGRPAPGSSMFNFGAHCGDLRCAAMALGFRVEFVRPQTWQKALGLRKAKGMKPVEWKNKLKAMAQRLYPDVEVTLKTADALLLLEWARRDRK